MALMKRNAETLSTPEPPPFEPGFGRMVYVVQRYDGINWNPLTWRWDTYMEAHEFMIDGQELGLLDTHSRVSHEWRWEGERPTFVAAREPDEEETYEEKKDKESGNPLRLTLFRRQDLATKETGYQRKQRRLGQRVYHNVPLTAQPFILGEVAEEDL